MMKNQRPDLMTDCEWKDFMEDIADGRYDYLKR